MTAVMLPALPMGTNTHRPFMSQPYHWATSKA